MRLAFPATTTTLLESIAKWHFDAVSIGEDDLLQGLPAGRAARFSRHRWNERDRGLDVDLRTYLSVLRRRKITLALCTLVAIGLAWLVVERATPQYASTAQLFISTPGSDQIGEYQGGLFSQARVSSYAEIVTGKAIAQRVVDELGLHESATALSGQVSSHVVPSTVLLDVTVTDASPSRARTLAEAFASQLRSAIAQLETPPGKAVSPVKATLVDPAPLPTQPVSPRAARDIGLAAVLGLLLGLGVAVLRETMDTSVNSDEDAVAVTHAPVLGRIPYDSGAPKYPLITDVRSTTARVEATRMLRTNLQYVGVDSASMVLVVTSSVPQEGKTTATANLAIAAATAGQSVVLVEGDLRRGRLAEYLHLEASVGLTTLLIGRTQLDETLQPWGQGGLDVITSGAIPPNPAELLQSQAMKRLLETLRARYDLVIIDSPPLLPVTDAAVLAAQADGALIVVRHAKTTKDQLGQAYRHLASVEARVLGTVINMVHRSAASQYDYAYGYAPERGRLRVHEADQVPVVSGVGQADSPPDR